MRTDHFVEGRTSRRPTLLGWLVCSLLGCTAQSREEGLAKDGGAGSGPGGDAGETEGAPGSGATTTGADGLTDTMVATDDEPGGDDEGSPRFDVAEGDESGGPGDDSSEEGCKKIDFLFVIDNSGSMGDNQERLIEGFPALMRAIQDELPDATDFHVGVTSTDPFDTVYPGAPDPCVVTRGGLISRSTEDQFAPSGFGPPCGFSSGERYMTNTPALADEFSCVARLGTSGEVGEQHAAALLAALSPPVTEAGGCNEDFLRSDAILVVVVLTDEDDVWSAPEGSWDPEPRVTAWFDSLVAVKGGVETSIIPVLISQGDPEYPECAEDFNFGPASTLAMFVRRFTYHFEANVCAPGYEDGLREAVRIIDTACDEFQPPP